MFLQTTQSLLFGIAVWNTHLPLKDHFYSSLGSNVIIDEANIWPSNNESNEMLKPPKLVFWVLLQVSDFYDHD